MAALAAVGTVGVLNTLRPAPPQTVDALVAVTEVSVGEEITRADLKRAAVPPHLLPEGAVSHPDRAVGEIVRTVVPAGGILTVHAFDSAQRFGPSPPGTLAAPIRFPDPQVVQLLQAGDRIDVFVAPTATQNPTTAEVVAREVLVLEIPQARESEGGLLGGVGPQENLNIVVLAVTEQEAAKLTAASQTGALSIALVQ